ncbi:MAG: hypothetical protein ACUVWY_01720, partial [Desulfosoma sp.]|uniref:hypothetical protein n=1 Tax=Desulfosoma sp. TaxID=2603217 RepID=UPI00404B3241
CLLKHYRAAFANIVRKNSRVPVKALSRGFVRRNPSKPLILLEPVIVYDARGSFKIAVARAQKPQIGLNYIHINPRLPQHVFFQPYAKPRLSVEQVSHQNRLGVDVVKRFPRLLDVDFLCVSTCQVEEWQQTICRKMQIKSNSCDHRDMSTVKNKFTD